MKKTLILIVISNLLIFTISQKVDIYEYMDKWSSVSHFYGQLIHNQTLFPNIQCDPCEYLIILYKESIQLIVENPLIKKVENFHFQIMNEQQENRIMTFDSKIYKIVPNDKSTINYKLNRFSRNGLDWKYSFTLPLQGVIIEGQILSSQYLIPALSLIMGIIVIVLLPLKKQGQVAQKQRHLRTPLISLLILSQVQHLILMLLLTISIKYIIWQQIFLLKFVWYICMLIPTSFMLLHIVYVYDAIRTVYYIKVLRITGKVKDVVLFSLMAVAVWAATILITYLDKTIIVFYYFSTYFVCIFASSLYYKKYPDIKLSAYFIVLIFFVLLLVNIMPLFWFQQHTLLEIVTFVGYFSFLFAFMSLIQKIVIKNQIYSAKSFEITNQLQLQQNAKGKVSEQNLQFDKQNGL